MKTTALVVALVLIAGCRRESGTNDDGSSNRYWVAGVDDRADVPKMLSTIQEMLASDERSALASMVAFPIKVRLGGKQVEITSKKQFLGHYGEIVNAKVRRAVARQNADGLFANYQGVMIGDGEIWFGPREGKLCIIAINN